MGNSLIESITQHFDQINDHLGLITQVLNKKKPKKYCISISQLICFMCKYLKSRNGLKTLTILWIKSENKKRKQN